MKRTLLLTATVASLAATAALAQAPSAPEGGGSNSKASTRTTKMVCRSESESGSRLNRRRVCVTQAEWDEQRRINRADVE